MRYKNAVHIFVLIALLVGVGIMGLSQDVLPTPNTEVALSKRSQLIKEAEKYLGLRYKTRIGKQIMDCSGYTKFILSKFDTKVTRSSVTQIKDGKRVENIKDARPGDILIFKGRNHKSNLPGHVALVHHWSNDTLYFIHSSVQKGITIDHIFQSYYSKRFMQIRNVIGD